MVILHCINNITKFNVLLIKGIKIISPLFFKFYTVFATIWFSYFNGAYFLTVREVNKYNMQISIVLKAHCN